MINIVDYLFNSKAKWDQKFIQIIEVPIMGKYFLRNFTSPSSEIVQFSLKEVQTERT